jgi:hypothetical protein
MDEDQILQSIIADPDVVDPTIDVSKLRQTTPTSSRLLGNVSGIEGLRFDPTRTDYIRDLYSVYGGGLPTIDVAPVVDTTTPVVDTTTPVVDTSGTDQVTGGGGTTPTETITPDPVVAPGEIPVTQEEIDAFNAPAVLDSTSTADEIMQDLTNQQAMLNPTDGNIMDEVALTGGVPDTNITAPSGDVFAAGDPLAEEKIDFVPEQQGLIDQAFSKVGSTANDIMRDLSEIPGAVANFVDKTVEIGGQKINVGATLLRAGINRIVGGPISLVFDLLQATGLEGGRSNLATELGKEYGMDDIGRLTSGPMAGYSPDSFGGDISKAALDRIDNIENRTAPQTDASQQKVRDLYDFVEKTTSIKSKQAAPQEEIGTVSGDVTTGVDFETGDLPGGGNIVDEFEPSDIQATDPDLDIPDRGRGDGGGQDTGPVSTAGQAGPPSQRGGGADMGSAAANEAAAAAQDAARGSYGGPPSQSGGGGGGSSGGGGKIVCTMMNESYGFGSFRNKIWLRHSKDLAPEYQKGYHKIFLPLVKLSKTNKVLKIMLEHIAVHRTIDIRQESRGKVHLLGRVYRKILEPICYLVGKYAK